MRGVVGLSQNTLRISQWSQEGGRASAGLVDSCFSISLGETRYLLPSRDGTSAGNDPLLRVEPHDPHAVEVLQAQLGEEALVRYRKALPHLPRGLRLRSWGSLCSDI